MKDVPHQSRLTYVLTVLALLLALALAACAGPAPAGAPADAAATTDEAAPAEAATGSEVGTGGGTLRYGRYADSLFLDPVLNDANLDIWVLNSLYDTLLQSTPDGQGTMPMLATEVAIADDGLSATVTLRPEIKFADGSPITPDDVKWSLDRARNPENGIWGFSLEAIESIETAGDNQVVINLSRPDPTLSAALAMFNSAIMPQKLFEAMPGTTDAEKAEAFAEKPIGSGPFVLTEWERGNYMVIERNPYYWQEKDGVQLPYLDAVRFEIVAEDATRILKLQAGELDGAEFIPLARVEELKADPNLTMELFPSTKVNDVIMNNRPELNDGTPNPLSDQKVRQALNYATDKNAIIQLVTYNTGVPMESYMSSTTPLFAKQQMYDYDLDKAKQLLAEAGYADGFDVSVMAIAGNADQSALLTALQNMWAQIGVNLTIEPLEAATLTERYRANDFQMRTAAWTNDINDPSQITSYFAIYSVIESLHSGFQNAEIEALYEQSQKELDPAARAEQYRQIQEIYVDQAPIIFLYEAPYPVALRSNVKGFLQIPLGQNIFTETTIEQ